MKIIKFWAIILIYILCNSSSCPGDYMCEFDGTCGSVLISAKVTPNQGIIYVGDTLTIEMLVPDLYFQTFGSDTTWVPITTFDNYAMEYNLYRIDTSQEGNVDQINMYGQSIQLEGGEMPDNTFTTTSPHKFVMKHIFKIPGICYLQSGYGLVLKLNGHIHPAILEWDVPYKNFDLFESLGSTFINQAQSADTDNKINYYPMVVWPK